ncbi:hypothetical protein DVH05_015033 [Phytophthora capsici]|nr:hypothetical protein DVH05_015033 [Phytophthora capsici]
MLSVPLVLFRGGDKICCSKDRVKLDWLGQLVVGLGAHFAALGELQRLAMETSVLDIKGSKQEKLMERSGNDQERPASSPCPSSSSSDESSSSASSPSSDSSDSSNNSSDSEEEAPPPPVNSGNGGGGNGGDDEKKKEGDGNNSDSSSSDSSADESDQEEDDGVMIDTDDEKDKVNNGIDPTDDDLSDESGGSSDLENSYPRLPSAPVDTLIAFRQQAALKELQMTEKLKKEVIEDAKQRLQGRQQSQRSKKKTPQSKRRQSKQSDRMSNGTHLERHHTNGSTGTADMKEGAEDEWLVDCSCGLKEKNYDDGTSMIQCDSCSHWVHAKCADKQPEAVAQEKFLCFQCSWMFDCVCDVRQRPNHDDGQRMVECESCKTWQHTMCVGIPMTEEPADDYQCPRCVRKARRRKSASNGSRSRDDRQRKRRHSEQSLHRRKSKDASPAVAVDVRSAARSIENLTTPTRAHRSSRTEPKESPKMERKAPLSSPPPVPAVSPPSSPPPPPSTPPPPAHVSGSSRRNRSHSRSKRKSERSSASNSSSNRKRGRSLGSSPSSSKKEHSADREEDDSPGVKPSPRGKGLMLRGYSPAARTETPLSRSVDVRPPLPLTPRSGSDHSYSSHNSGGRKRKTSSARDRLAKKLKIKKSSLR